MFFNAASNNRHLKLVFLYCAPFTSITRELLQISKYFTCCYRFTYI